MVTAHDRNTCLEIVCFRCQRKLSVWLNRDDLRTWKEGTCIHDDTIQDCLPYLSEDERCLLIDRRCGRCFDELFSTEGESTDER